jgi:D-glutamate cyclase
VKNDELSYNLGEVVDRLISVQYFMSGGGSALTRKPVTGLLYEAAREKAGAPLCHLAAKALADNVKRGDTVLITTGLIAPPYMVAEGDGPIAAATLARAVDVGLDATPIIVCEAVMVKAMEALCQAAGLMPSAPELAVGTPRKVILLPFPLDEELARREAIRLLDQFKPKALVAIEKLSKNTKGIYHNGFGIDVSSVQAKVDHLFDVGRERDIATIGVGDGGNEIGTACIAEAVRKVVPTGANCGCPCASGIAAATETDYCVFGSKSNYGGFAIEACLAAGLERPEILHSEIVGRRVHEAGASMGLVDPFTGLAFGWDDFPVDKNVNELVVNLIRYMLAVRVVPRWYQDSIMGPSQKWIHERTFAEELLSRWAKSIAASDKEFFPK